MKRKVIYLQEDTYSCGSICIQSVVSFYGGYVPLETVLDDTNTDKTGTNAFEIVNALRKYGFTSYGKHVALDDINRNDLPVIAHVIKDGLEHFLVIYGIEGDFVVTMDPEFGEKKYSRKFFKEIYDDKAIYLFKNGDIPKYKPSTSYTKLIKESISSNRRLLLFITLICLVSLILSFFLSFYFKLLSQTDNPLKLTLLFLFLRLFTSSILIIKNALTERLIREVDITMTDKISRHIFYLPMRFLNRKKTGEIVRKIDDISFIKELVLRICIVNTLDVLMIIISLLAMFIISWKMALVDLIIGFMLSMITVFADNKLYKKNKECLRSYDEYMGTLVEAVSGIESIKNLNREEGTISRLSQYFKIYSSSRSKLSNFIGRSKEMKSTILDMGMLISNLLGFLNLNDTFTFYDLVTLQSLFGLFTTSLESILDTAVSLTRGRAIYRSVCEFLDIEEEPQSGQKVGPTIDSLKIENLTYSYDRLHKNIDNFSINIDRGDKILLCGPSGIGKSTLVKCLCGKFDNYRGKITLNGIDLKNVSLSSLRNHLIYIGQEETLFSGTIEKNITDGNYDENLFNDVIKITNLEDVIKKKPEGRNSVILEGASNISGGERSRITLARALYKKPSIIVIDETLSSVSEDMEEEILTKLLARKDLTVIYITHRQKEHLFQKIVYFRKEGNYEITNK